MNLEEIIGTLESIQVEDDDDLRIAINASIAALRVQIPIKVENNDTPWYECPNHCSEITPLKKYQKYCHICGQALKWTD